MLILFLLFSILLLAIAKAPGEVIQCGLAMAWALMVIGCVASVLGAL
jgi:hypothetical protein